MIEKLNLQQVFDKVATHLLTQGQKSTDDNGSCTYRGKNNTTCAVGCLIPDSRYYEYLEGRTAVDGDVLAALADVLDLAAVTLHPTPGWPTQEAMIRLLSRLQGIHDTFAVAEWPEKLKRLAGDLGLDSSRVDLVANQIQAANKSPSDSRP